MASKKRHKNTTKKKGNLNIKFEIEYYFEEMEKGELFEILTKEKQEVMEIFDSSSALIGEIESSGKQEIHTTQIQENVKIMGNVYIGEGAEIEVIKDENKEPIKLGREAIGIILGDNSRIGSNCTTSPGTFVGKFTWVYPHTCIHGFIPELTKVYDKQNMVFMPNERKVLYKSTDWNYGNHK